MSSSNVNQILWTYHGIQHNKLMKIALCIYGHFRCFDTCWPELQANLIEPNRITDVFAASWTDSMGYFQHPEHSENHKHHPGYDSSSERPSLEYMNWVLDVLKPRAHGFHDFAEQEVQFDRMIRDLERWHHPSIHHRPKGTLGQVWGRCASIALKQWYEQRHGFKYDHVVVTRWDIAHSKPIIIGNLPGSIMVTDGMYGPDVISDAWACGPGELVDAWGQQFARISDLVGLGTMNLGPHEWLKAHFELMEIPWVARPDVGIWIRR